MSQHDTSLSRRRFLTSTNKAQAKKLETSSSQNDSLDAYEGEWNFASANHLLRRTTFGATFKQIQEAENSGLDATINNLFRAEDLPDEPINYHFEADTVPIGESWVDKPLDRTISGLRPSRERSFLAWSYNQIYKSPNTILEKLCLFWQNHFAIQKSEVNDPNFLYKYRMTIRENAFGNFKSLVEKITIEPAMLQYLDGHTNRKNSPNENYARELLELFTIGKGPLAGPNDYTTFTEDDVISAAKVLSGWVFVGRFGSNGDTAGSSFRPNIHNVDSKQFSHRFNNTILENQNETEYLSLINMIFEQDEVSRHICRKFYKWFVHYNITEDIELNIIEPLAEILRNSNYEVEPVLKILLSSCHFYNECNRGSMIKNPIDFLLNTFKQHEIILPAEDVLFEGLYLRYQILTRFESVFTNNEMSYYQPPSVAGWKAYYQEPLYNRIWISSVTLANRQGIVESLINQRRISSYLLGINFIDYVATLSNPFDIDTLIDDIVSHIFSKPVSENQRQGMLDIIENWNNEYGEYIAEPEGTERKDELRTGVESKLKNLFNTLLKMPEYYLS